jgi:outer membrane protein assembly factor BamB
MKPLVLDDKIIISSFDKRIYALSHDGREIWNLLLNGVCIGEPLYVNGKIFVGATGGRMYAITPDGKILWSYFAGSDGIGSANYIIETDSIAFGTIDGYIHNVGMDGRALWKFKCDGTMQTRYHSDAIGDVIFCGSGDTRSGMIYAIDARRGNVMWKFPTSGRVHGIRALGDFVFCPCMDSNLYSFRKDGQLAWKFRGDGPFNAPPGFNSGLIFQSSWNGHVYCLCGDGRLVWKIYFPGQPADVKRVFSPIERIADRMRSFLTFWKPEKPPSKAYETKSAPQLTLGPAAYSMSEPYKSEMKYEKSGAIEYTMGKKKDWRQEMEERIKGKR